MYTYMVSICIAAGQLRCSTTVVWWTGSEGREPLQPLLSVEGMEVALADGS